LFASLFWGSVGVGYFIYGKKQREWVPMAGGAGIILVSYLVGSPMIMSLASIGLMVAVYVAMKRGW
jgi:hypothetical protein